MSGEKIKYYICNRKKGITGLYFLQKSSTNHGEVAQLVRAYDS